MTTAEFEQEFDEATEPPELPEITATDDGNALRLIAEHGDEIRRVADMRRWFIWDGCRWALDHDDRAVREYARNSPADLPEDDKTAKRSRATA